MPADRAAGACERDWLRFLTAGSVDNGKCAFIGRLLFDVYAIYRDLFAAVEAASGKSARGIDFSPGGDNIARRSERTPWYDGPTLVEYLETVPIASGRDSAPFRHPVQSVVRSDSGERFYTGPVAPRVVRVGRQHSGAAFTACRPVYFNSRHRRSCAERRAAAIHCRSTRQGDGHRQGRHAR